MARYTSHIWKPFAGTSGGSYTGGPRKFVIHTTEGSSAAGAFAAYKDGGVPHFTWEWKSKSRWQHHDTNVAASALRNDPGGVQTNRDGAIQVEIVGFAGAMHLASDDELAWYGAGVREVCEREGIDWRKAPTFYGTDAGFVLASKTARQRMSYATWDAFNGVCGHQHVPENSHWDPGKLDYPRLIELTEDDDMPLNETDKTIIRNILNQEVPGLVAQAIDDKLGDALRVAVGKNLGVDGAAAAQVRARAQEGALAALEGAGLYVPPEPDGS